MGVRVSIVASADLSILQLETQCWILYYHIMTTSVLNLLKRNCIDEFWPALNPALNLRRIYDSSSSAATDLKFKLKTKKGS